MVLTATLDLELARVISEAVPGPKTYIIKKHPVEALWQKVHRIGPGVVLLDVRFGGQEFRAIEAVRQILEAPSEPEVILLLPWASKAVERQAENLDCFDVLDFSRPAFRREVVKAVAAAASERKVRSYEHAHHRKLQPRRGVVH
jgi:DNA-binding NarL/FixJ family response regulator